MAKSLSPQRNPPPMLSLFGGLQIDPRIDAFQIEGSAGVISVSVRRPNGDVQTATVRAEGRMTEWSNFEPRGMSADRRRRLVKEMRRAGLSQSTIAKKLGVSQATVSLDLRRK